MQVASVSLSSLVFKSCEMSWRAVGRRSDPAVCGQRKHSLSKVSLAEIMCSDSRAEDMVVAEDRDRPLGRRSSDDGVSHQGPHNLRQVPSCCHLRSRCSDWTSPHHCITRQCLCGTPDHAPSRLRACKLGGAQQYIPVGILQTTSCGPGLAVCQPYLRILPPYT